MTRARKRTRHKKRRAHKRLQRASVRPRCANEFRGQIRPFKPLSTAYFTQQFGPLTTTHRLVRITTTRALQIGFEPHSSHRIDPNHRAFNPSPPGRGTKGEGTHERSPIHSADGPSLCFAGTKFYCFFMRNAVSSKGQITIPQAVRSALHIRPGDVLRFRAERGRLIGVKAAGNDRVDQVYGILKLGRGTDEVIRGLRGRRHLQEGLPFNFH